MPIEFSSHAKFQIRKRHLAQKLIRKIVKDPDVILPSYKNRRLRRKLVGGKILQAVTITEGSRITVISGYFLRRKI